MQSLNGTAWINLTFTIKDNESQAIDEFGLTKLSKKPINKDQNITTFLFTITKTKNGILLKGLEGTAWSSLKFSLLENEKQLIGQLGME